MSDIFTEHVTWPDRPTDDDLKRLPARPAVLLMQDAAGAPVQLMATQSLRRALQSRLIDAAPTGQPDTAADQPERGARWRADVGEVVRGVRWRPVSSPFEARWRHWQVARELYPRDYREQIMFGPAWFLHFGPAAAIPEIRVTEHVWRDPGEYIGPWPTRAAAQAALETLWDLFDLCRYPEQTRRAPRGQRCAYAEMGRCDAPCDGSAPMEPYRARSAAAWRFAGGAGDEGRAAAREWFAASHERMRSAAAQMQFERAALIKRQIEAAQRWPGTDVVLPRRDAEMRWLLAIPTSGRRKWKAFLFDLGYLEEGPETGEKALAQACETWRRSRRAIDPTTLDPDRREEQTWLVCHFLAHEDARKSRVITIQGPMAQVDPEHLFSDGRFEGHRR